MDAQHTRPPRPRYISAEHLKLALVARRVRPATRWAAMSDHAATNLCRLALPGGGYCMHQPPLLAPMCSGFMRSLLDRVRSHGRAEVLRTWQTGMRVLKAEFSTSVLRHQPAGR